MPESGEDQSAAEPDALQRYDALQGATAVGTEERDADRAPSDDGQEDLEGLVELGLEVRGLDLGEVAELADEDDDEGRGDLLPARRRPSRIAASRSTLLLLFGLGTNSRYAAPRRGRARPTIRSFQCTGNEREQRPGADRDAHLDDQRRATPPMTTIAGRALRAP